MRKLILTLLIALAAIGQSAAQDESRLAIGYVTNFANQDATSLPWRRLTHVCHAFLALDAEGNLVTNQRIPSAELTNAAHANGVQVLLSLGGGRTADGLEQVTAKPETLLKYARAVVKAVVDNGYDGVDLHWEFPRDRESRAGFVALVAMLRKGLDAAAAASERDAPYLLTAAVSHSGYFGKWIDVGATLGRLDWLHVMAYDMAGPWSQTAGHHAPLFPSPKDPQRAWRSVSLAMRYWHEERGVPRSKLVVGIPMYGRAYPVAARLDELDPARRNQHGLLPFREIRDLVGRGWPADFDPVSQAAWLQAPDGKPLLIAYDDSTSVRKKATWARDEGYRGLFYWSLHQDRMSDGAHWLLKAADKAWPVTK